jgi:pilus assembly protein Flp/PilA
MSMIDRLFVQMTSAIYGASREEGQGLAEYGLILALVAVLCVGALQLLQKGVGNTLNSVTSNL